MWQTLLSVVVGGMLTLGGSIVLDVLRVRRRRASLRAALAAEVCSIVELIQRQNYVTEIREFANSIGSPLPPPHNLDLVVPLKQSYFTIYEANASTLGELPAPIAAKVVRFYQGAKSLADSLSGEATTSIFHPAERIAKYRLVADSLEELCGLGEEVARQLSSSQVVKA